MLANTSFRFSSIFFGLFLAISLISFDLAAGVGHMGLSGEGDDAPRVRQAALTS